MRVDTGFNPYSAKYIKNELSRNTERLPIRSQKLSNDIISKNINELDRNELISGKERNFFKSMFPDSSEQIENYILFNRNGQIQNAAMVKGTIFDKKF